MKCKEKEDEIELRRLRTENSLLRQRIDFLETESSDLADRSAVAVWPRYYNISISAVKGSIGFTIVFHNHGPYSTNQYLRVF